MVIDYALLRVMPDPARGEFLNVGVVALGDRPLVRMAFDVKRLVAFHPDLRALDFSVWAQQTEDILMQLQERAQQLMWIRGGMAPIAADEHLGQLAVERADELENALDELLTRWVRTPQRTVTAKRRAPASTSPLNREVRQWLRKANLFSAKVSDISQRRVVPNYPVAVEEDLFADFALMNGALHLIETLDLRGAERLTRSRLGEVSLKAITLAQASEMRHSIGRRMVLWAADDYKAMKPAANLLHRYSDDLLAIHSAEDRRRLVDFLADSLQTRADLPPLPFGSPVGAQLHA